MKYLDEARQVDETHHVFVRGSLPLLQQQRFGDAHPKALEELTAREFIVSERGGQHAAARIGDAEHIEIALQASVFSRRAVNGDIGVVEEYLRAVRRTEAEVVAVYRHVAFGQFHVPVRAVHHYDVRLVPVFVDKRANALRATQGHFVFGGVTPGHYGYNAFHSISLLLM